MTLAAAMICLVTLGGGCGEKNPTQPTPHNNTWALTVKVTGPQQVPVRSATVRVMDGPNATRTAMSDQSGTAVFTELKEGTFSIEVTAQEYYRATASVSLTTSRTITVAMNERNRAPVIKSLVTEGALPKQPSGLADVGEELQLVATVTDNETAINQLTFAWTASLGTLTGTGASVRWRAPSSGAWPATASITVTITERFTPPDSTQPEENRTTGELKVRVHQSRSEVAVIAATFLSDFSNSDLKNPETVIRNFSTSARCATGVAEELQDVAENRLNYRIIASTPFSAVAVAPTVSLGFQGPSPWGKPADAWVLIPCGWTSIGTNPAIPTEYNKTMTVSGTCKLTAIYDVDRWALCHSNFDGAAGTAGARFIR